VLAGLSVAAAIAAAGYLIFADTYSGSTCIATTSGPAVCSSKSSSLIKENGVWVLALLSVPIALSAAGLMTTLPRFDLPWFLGWLVAVSFALLCVVAMFSIGFFFVPSALLLLIATATNGYRRAYRSDEALPDGAKASSLRRD
jgi:hypothetical protein